MKKNKTTSNKTTQKHTKKPQIKTKLNDPQVNKI